MAIPIQGSILHPWLLHECVSNILTQRLHRCTVKTRMDARNLILSLGRSSEVLLYK